MKTIKIVHLYYDLMNLYGENGNIRFLKRKLEDQGLNVEVHFLTIDDKIDFEKYDFFYMGTGSEENQMIVLEDMMKYKDDIKKAIKNDKFFLATGNALELFGRQIRNKVIDQEPTQLLETFDFVCENEDMRIVGEQFYKTDLIDHVIVGFENRACTMSEYHSSLFKVIKGCGFRPDSEYEGILENNFYGTYLFGPLLVRNPYFTDYLVKKITEYLEIDYKEPDFNDTAYKAYNEYIKNFFNEKE